MKKLLSLLTLALCLTVVTSCNDDEALPNGYIETTQTGSSTTVLKGYNDYSKGFTVLKPTGFNSPIYMKDGKFVGSAYDYILASGSRLEDLTDVPESGNWQSEIAVSQGATYWARYAGNNYKYIKFRVAYIDDNNVGLEYLVSDHTTIRPNSNANDESIGYAGNTEMPHLNSDLIFAAHTTVFEGSTYMNLAIEWNPTLRHANWVAYSFDKQTSRSLVSRGSNWTWDPLISEGTVEESNHKSDGYDKGHLCASADRLFSTEANDQTFYYTNISPMIHRFNTGFWENIETVVRNWGHATIEGTYDKVYITKGATLNDLKKNWKGSYAGNDNVTPTTDANGLTKGGLAVPAYYYIAVLAEKDGVYQAIAFLVEHNEEMKSSYTTADLQAVTLSVNDLEEYTGVDFFCNLPDETEELAEGTFDVGAWTW